MEFRIYDVPTGGAPLWEELWTGGNAVSVSDGLFSVLLGSLNTGLTAVVQSHDALYLGVTVGTDSEMSPRVQLGSVPFSMQALTVPDGSITTAKLADGAVTSHKVNLDHGTICLSAHAQVSLPGNWQMVTVPGLNLDFTLNNPSQVLVWIDGLFSPQQQSNGEIDIHLLVDNVPQTGSFASNTDEGWYNVKGQRLLNLDSGTHSITAKANSWNPATVTVHGLGSYRTCINYLVLGEQ